ncbi:uncharacterized protein STEHIDRAFT_114996 [Stereum hirsutum FP-91666 SS1]|uniref:uncharacterized protein n=1 Tax=Stereum hirsutum (strain FP-91666) TaxID=721885 RepID=UPI0004449F63|nr:uncharacterized protein STEHIDRAFT_114996 [Stereum hirsutum FP-91666 SS1]EIM81585.1 hypothetical protein STEHIDRAFT_114996 [Stereum hirsutum FP-91666 SS1]
MQISTFQASQLKKDGANSWTAKLVRPVIVDGVLPVVFSGPPEAVFFAPIAGQASKHCSHKVPEAELKRDKRRRRLGWAANGATDRIGPGKGRSLAFGKFRTLQNGSVNLQAAELQLTTLAESPCSGIAVIVRMQAHMAKPASSLKLPADYVATLLNCQTLQGLAKNFTETATGLKLRKEGEWNSIAYTDMTVWSRLPSSSMVFLYSQLMARQSIQCVRVYMRYPGDG